MTDGDKLLAAVASLERVLRLLEMVPTDYFTDVIERQRAAEEARAVLKLIVKGHRAS